MNFGESKRSTFERVLIFPTDKMKQYFLTGDLRKVESIIPKFYVAVTHAKHSVAFVYDGNVIEGLVG